MDISKEIPIRWRLAVDLEELVFLQRVLRNAHDREVKRVDEWLKAIQENR
jgi:hypothetical protein